VEIILASASSRRQELLVRLIENFKIVVSDFDEDSVKFEGDCGSYVRSLSEGKALNVGSKITGDAIIIACDTIVAIKDKILGEPKDEEEAFYMLKLLSGNIHQVYSGITVLNKVTGEVKSDSVCTDVKFDDLLDEQIIKYIEKGEYKDKAGAYGIQGYGGIFVKEIHGCYYNVVGLPLNKLSKMLKEMGVNL